MSRAGKLLLATVTVPLLGCGTMSAPVDHGAMHAEVGALLARNLAAFDSRDAQAIRDCYVTDGRFAWHEDGVCRYESVDDIVQTLTQFPASMSFATTYSDTEVVAVERDAAAVHTRFATTIHDGSDVFAFTGVITMLVVRDEDRWLILSGHSSTPKARG